MTPTGLLSEPELYDRVERLAALDRPSASAGELAAAELIAGELREVPGVRVRIERETVHGTHWWPTGLPVALATLGGLLGGQMAGRGGSPERPSARRRHGGRRRPWRRGALVPPPAAAGARDGERPRGTRRPRRRTHRSRHRAPRRRALGADLSSGARARAVAALPGRARAHRHEPAAPVGGSRRARNGRARRVARAARALPRGHDDLRGLHGGDGRHRPNARSSRARTTTSPVWPCCCRSHAP